MTARDICRLVVEEASGSAERPRVADVVEVRQQ
jgi:hypothetical protein